jgi:SAM-dependent methyltransferase
MKKSEYARMEEHEKNYWWHLGRLRIIKTYVSRALVDKQKAKIMNVGCGTGGTIDMLEKFGTVDNVDISDDAISFMKQNGYTRLTKVDDIALPFKDKTYDMVGAFDVLEHIENQTGALKEWKRILKDDGAVVITVPAYQWLWSDHDKSLYHERRYTTARIKQAATEAGLRVEKKSYAIVFSLPLVVAFRYINKITGKETDSETSYVEVPKWVNSLFTQFLYLEALMHNFIKFPFGTTVVTILKKK